MTGQRIGAVPVMEGDREEIHLLDAYIRYIPPPPSRDWGQRSAYHTEIQPQRMGNYHHARKGKWTWYL